MKKFIRGKVKIYFYLLKIKLMWLNKFKSKGFLASSVSPYDFSTLYTKYSLSHNLIKEKRTQLI